MRNPRAELTFDEAVEALEDLKRGGILHEGGFEIRELEGRLKEIESHELKIAGCPLSSEERKKLEKIQNRDLRLLTRRMWKAMFELNMV